MDLDTCFSIASSTALVGWLLLALLPRWRWSAGGDHWRNDKGWLETHQRRRTLRV